MEDGENAVVSTQNVTVIPGSNIYYSDILEAADPVTVGDGYGYNAGIEYQAPSKEYGDTASESFYFTFSGTGIDVYCTTTSSAGYVQAAVFKGTNEGNSLGERVGSPVIMKNTSAENRYNTPTISFTGLDNGTYTVKITAMKNSHYLLDGIRVYNPTSESILTETDEAETTYLNLRKLLLNEESGFSVSKPDSFDSDFDLGLVIGALYLDDEKNLVTTTLDAEGNKISLFGTNFDAYKKDGPKNEIYLDEGQGITFQLNTSKFTKDTKVWVGLSAPVTGSGEVYISGSEENTAVTSKMDMYYPINIDADNTQTKTVTITNQTDSLISVTNLKISGVADLIEKAMAGTDGINSVAGLRKAKMLLFSPMTTSVIEDAAENGLSPVVVTGEDNDSGSVIEDDDKPTVTPSEEPTENVNDDPEEEPTIQPTETPTVEPSAEPSVEPSATPDAHPSAFSRVVQTISRMVSSLFGSISRLFGR